MSLTMYNFDETAFDRPCMYRILFHSALYFLQFYILLESRIFTWIYTKVLQRVQCTSVQKTILSEV